MDDGIKQRGQALNDAGFLDRWLTDSCKGFWIGSKSVGHERNAADLHGSRCRSEDSPFALPSKKTLLVVMQIAYAFVNG